MELMLSKDTFNSSFTTGDFEVESLCQEVKSSTEETVSKKQKSSSSVAVHDHLFLS